VRDELLPAAGLAADEERRVHRRHPRGARLERSHRLALAEDGVEASTRRVRLQRLQSLADAPRGLEHDDAAGGRPPRRLRRLVDGRRVEEEGLAADGDLPRRRAEPARHQLALEGLVA